jgi:hypothetical protein
MVTGRQASRCGHTQRRRQVRLRSTAADLRSMQPNFALEAATFAVDIPSFRHKSPPLLAQLGDDLLLRNLSFSGAGASVVCAKSPDSHGYCYTRKSVSLNEANSIPCSVKVPCPATFKTVLPLASESSD